MAFHRCCPIFLLASVSASISRCPFLLPPQRCEGELANQLADGGKNCLAYAVLNRSSTCAEFCRNRRTRCVRAVDNREIGVGCDFDMDKEVDCYTDGLKDVHCVCEAFPKPDCQYMEPLDGGERLCQSGSMAERLTYMGGGPNCIAQAVLFGEKSCDSFCAEKGAQCMTSFQSDGNCVDHNHSTPTACSAQTTHAQRYRYCVCKAAPNSCSAYAPVRFESKELACIKAMATRRHPNLDPHFCAGLATLGKDQTCQHWCLKRGHPCTAAVHADLCRDKQNIETEEEEKLLQHECHSVGNSESYCLCQAEPVCSPSWFCSQMCGAPGRCSARCIRRFSRVLPLIGAMCREKSCQQIDSADTSLLQFRVAPSQGSPCSEHCETLCGQLLKARDLWKEEWGPYEVACNNLCLNLPKTCDQCADKYNVSFSHFASLQTSSEAKREVKDVMDDVKPFMIKHRHGLCLDASGRGELSGLVHMWPCDSSNDNQFWVWTPTTRQIKSASGLCLDAKQRNQDGGTVHMWTCETWNQNQMWEFQGWNGELGGLIKAYFGRCLDSPESGNQGGLVHMWNCWSQNPNQQWDMPALNWMFMNNKPDFALDDGRNVQALWTVSFGELLDACSSSTTVCAAICYNPGDYSYIYGEFSTITNPRNNFWEYRGIHGSGWHCYRRPPSTTFGPLTSFENLGWSSQKQEQFRADAQTAMNSVFQRRIAGCDQDGCLFLDDTWELMAIGAKVIRKDGGGSAAMRALRRPPELLLSTTYKHWIPWGQGLIAHEFAHATDVDHPPQSEHEAAQFWSVCKRYINSLLGFGPDGDETCTEERPGSLRRSQEGCQIGNSQSESCLAGAGCWQKCVPQSYAGKLQNPQDWVMKQIVGCAIYYHNDNCNDRLFFQNFPLPYEQYS
mmetsp:Transcript_53665/g.125065  ORF Transcript_53665/g.125065 Transcript_53665/m.125065 type:complete len:897 (+) Transcript_53665:52-2742(+)